MKVKLPCTLESCVWVLRTGVVHPNAASATAYVFGSLSLPSSPLFHFLLSTLHPSVGLRLSPHNLIFPQCLSWNSFHTFQTSMDQTLACVRIIQKHFDSLGQVEPKDLHLKQALGWQCCLWLADSTLNVLVEISSSVFPTSRTVESVSYAFLLCLLEGRPAGTSST